MPSSNLGLIPREQPARQHHYRFVHQELRHMATVAPEKLFEFLSGFGGDQFLTTLWETVGQALPERDRVKPEGLKHRPTIIDGRMACMITLPKAEFEAEAHLVCLVSGKTRSNSTLRSRTQSPRFYTLELGYRADGERYTVLGEWDGTIHINHGDGPPPNQGEFERAIVNLMRDTRG